jgi:hypothetical protein
VYTDSPLDRQFYRRHLFYPIDSSRFHLFQYHRQLAFNIQNAACKYCCLNQRSRYGATLQVEDVQHQFIRLRTALRFYSHENKKQSNLLIWPVANKQGLKETDSRESIEDSDSGEALTLAAP